MPNCKIITIAIQKGGTSKTSATFNLGVVLPKFLKRILLVDCEPQEERNIADLVRVKILFFC